MKVIEILKLNRELLNICRDVGIRAEDVQYIELYNDYNRLLAAGEKVSYIVVVLMERHVVSERRVYTLIKRLRTDCNLCAVQLTWHSIGEGTPHATFVP